MTNRERDQRPAIAGGSSETERRHWLVIELLAARTPLAEIEATTGYRPRTIRQIAQRFREAGAAGLIDGRQHSTGAAPLIAAELQGELRRVLRCPPPGGGDWTGPKVARWIEERTGKRVHRQRGWEYLRRFGPSDADG